MPFIETIELIMEPDQAALLMDRIAADLDNIPGTHGLPMSTRLQLQVFCRELYVRGWMKRHRSAKVKLRGPKRAG